jgi:lipopolysaccharide/colanic/teichoic acid biosynthesis glycosyltransferase
MSNEKIAKKLYQTIPLGANIVDFESFYESIVEKVPVYLINETWFLENIRDINKKNIDILKRIFDIIFSVILGIPTLLLAPLIFLLSKIESNDRLIVRQERVGKNGKIFMLLKFRSMYSATEKDGKAKWADKNDSRITKFGNIIRKTRIDELPQVWNIFKGEMSFVGPRPERPEFVSQLEKQIPHYAMRHLVKPGLSGWAQIKFSYGASVEDAMEKLQHDLYYIKNRSLVLELAIAVKTIKTILAREGR